MKKYRHILLKGFKIAIGTVLAIVIAELLDLQFPTSAGTVALLTLLTTKKGTVKLIVQRLLTFMMTVLCSLILFQRVPVPMLAFTLVMVIVATAVIAFKAEATLSINALIAIHFLTEMDFSREFILNEFLLVLIGVVIAFLLNLIHHYAVYEDELDDAIRQVDSQIQSLLKDIVEYIRHPESHSSSWGELGKLEKMIQDKMKVALEYDENVFGNHSEYYVNFFEVREFQCEILHMLHYEIRKIRTMPEQAHALADYLEYVIPHIHESNDPEPQLDALHDLLKGMQMKELPATHDEFESRAILYHILMDFEDFLMKKKRFVEQLDKSDKILHWRKK